MKLTISKLKKEAIDFIKYESSIAHDDLIGITDGKTIGTYIEHKFEAYLKSKYEITIGSSAKGIDLPDPHINTDIKVTSIKILQTSSPFKSIEQKIYGLGYNLLVFVYEKEDIGNSCYLNFKHCIFIEEEKTSDYNLTKVLRKMINLGAKKEDIIEILNDKNVPGDEEILETLAEKILKNPPKQGYLTISNAFQWRLKYSNIINSKNEIEGIDNYEKHNAGELIDFQTPLYFTNKICEYLKNDLKINPDIIIEPTCGFGNFLKSCSNIFPKRKLYGIDIDENKLNKVDRTIPNLKLINEDIFNFKFDAIDKNNSFLIIGNPPLITNAKLSEINSHDSNSKNRNDTAKMTNASNFDISESIIIKMINEFKHTDSTIAFICKTTASNNIFIELVKKNIGYSFIKQLNFDSYKIFNIDMDACLLIIQFGKTPTKNKICEFSDISNPSKVLYSFGFAEGKTYSKLEGIPPIDGNCQMEWKQGIKHDCAKIMELNFKNGQLINKNNEIVPIEKSLLYPLLKSGDIKKPIVKETSKYIIITQRKIKQDTSYIKNEAPKTWNYLNANKKYFDRRKSSSYNNAPEFSIDGIGNPTFKKYKVAISGSNKKPKFSLVYHEKPMMVDDTCYYLSFDDYDDAYITMLILNSKLVKRFLENIAVINSKRHYSKKVLKRIDMRKCLNLLLFEDLKGTEKELGLNEYITNEKYMNYKNNIHNVSF